jgi:redox-sensitive bicupin YhaK (pirin superfamily)
MITIRKAAQRGGADHGWLKTHHTFSFADYYDAQHMGFRALRVLNEDWIAPGTGFGTHPHRDMEILTCVLAGSLQHRDSLRSGSVLRPGEMQRITAGTGILHSETNPSHTEPVHLYQIWLVPERRGLAPAYEQRAFPPGEHAARLQLVASRDGREGSLTVHQDVEVYLASLKEGEVVKHSLAPGRHAWVQMLRGHADCNNKSLEAGDGVAFSQEAEVLLRAVGPAEIMLFDLA